MEGWGEREEMVTRRNRCREWNDEETNEIGERFMMISHY